MEEPQNVSLTINLFPDGRINVTGPLHNVGMCYMLLEMARDCVKDNKDKARLVESQINSDIANRLKFKI